MATVGTRSPEIVPNGKRIRWPVELKDALIEKQGGKCWVCGEACSWLDWTESPDKWGAYPTFEHKVPLCAGGEDVLHNLAISHQACNNGRNHFPTGPRLA